MLFEELYEKFGEHDSDVRWMDGWMDAPSPGIARVIVGDLQNGEHARRNAER